MGRIRSIKPEFTQDEELSTLPSDAHLFAVGLICYADDAGYFNANPGLLKAAIFPLRETLQSVPEFLRSLQDIGFVELANPSRGKQYGRIVNFDIHQRVSHPSPSKIKPLWNPPEILRNPPEVFAPEGKGKEVGRDVGKEVGKEVGTRGSEPEKNSGSKPAANGDVLFRFLLNDKSQFELHAAEVEKYRELYPAVDIEQECRAMIGWLDANDTKRKTKQGIKRFINGWLTREQDKPHVDRSNGRGKHGQLDKSEQQLANYEAARAKGPISGRPV